MQNRNFNFLTKTAIKKNNFKITAKNALKKMQLLTYDF